MTIKLETIRMSEPPVNIVKLAVGIHSVEELALVQRQFLNHPGVDANKGYYHSTNCTKKHEAIVKSGFCMGDQGRNLREAKILSITKQKIRTD